MINEISNILKIIRSGNIDKAFHLAKTLYLKNENNLDAVKLLAYTYIQIGNFERVVEVLQKAYKNKDDQKDFDYYNNMAYSMSQLEDYEHSIQHVKEAIKLNKSNNSSPYIICAEIYLKLRDFEKANKNINNAINIIKANGNDTYTSQSNAFLLKSEINSALKKDDKTIELFEEILKEKFNENIFYILTNINPKFIDDKILNEAESRVLLNDKSFSNKIERFNYVTPLYFGLGNSYQSKDINKSEKYFDLANDEIFNNTRYNSHQYQKKILETTKLYEEKYKSHNESDDNVDGKSNIFIVGSPRSGTTLLESIVTANGDVFSGGELKSAKSLIENHVLSSDKNFAGFRHLFKSKYLRRTSYLKGKYNYIVDKMPENFLYIGYLLKLLPKAKIIRMYRNPWDIAVSLYRQRYVQNVPYSCSFFNIGIFLANHEAINLFWDKEIQDKSNILDIKYEDLVSNHKIYQQKIYKFLEIHSNYDEKKREGFFSPTASIRQVQNKVHQKSIKKKEFLHKKDEFLNAYFMQREFWQSKGFIEKPEKTVYFGYL